MSVKVFRWRVSRRGNSVGGDGKRVCRVLFSIPIFGVAFGLLLQEGDVFFFFFFPFIFISWRLSTLQYCSGFCHTLTWISHGFTCIPHPDPPWEEGDVFEENSWEVCIRANSFQSHPTCYNTVDHSLPGSSVHGDSPGKNTRVDCHALLQGDLPNSGMEPTSLMPPALAGGFFTATATWKAQLRGKSLERRAVSVRLSTATRGCQSLRLGSLKSHLFTWWGEFLASSEGKTVDCKNTAQSDFVERSGIWDGWWHPIQWWSIGAQDWGRSREQSSCIKWATVR